MNVVYISLMMVLLLWTLGGLLRRRKNRNSVICIVESNCTGCGRCVRRCTRHVLAMAKNEAGIHATIKDPGQCTACGDCLRKCKFNAMKLIGRT